MTANEILATLETSYNRSLPYSRLGEEESGGIMSVKKVARHFFSLPYQRRISKYHTYHIAAIVLVQCTLV